MALKYEKPPGTEDLLPGEPDPDQPPEDRILYTSKWQAVEDLFRDVCARFGFAEIRTPVFEETDLFVRSVGAGTDIVSKEMYTFEDRGGRSMTLRPEGTAPVVRAFLQHKLYGRAKIHKFFYLCPIFRYERQQRGRYRQHHQAGVEFIGEQNPRVDVEVISLGWTYLTELGLEDIELHLNSVGCPACRPHHRRELVAFLKTKLDSLCRDCHHRYELNPLRVLDCKEERCQRETAAAPVMVDFLCPECQEHFSAVRDQLNTLGLGFTFNPRLVRGLDYYTKTAFEITHETLGTQNVLLGGGRYDGLIEQCGGDPTPGIGFGSGLERTLLVLEQTARSLPRPERRPVFLAAVSESERRQAQVWALKLRRAGIGVEEDYEGRSLKAQLRAANRLRAVITVFLREENLAQGWVTLRQMDNGTQEEVRLDELIPHLGNELARRRKP